MKTEINQVSWKIRLGLALLNGGIFTLTLFLIRYFMDGEVLNWYSIIFQGVFFGLFMAIGFPYLFGKLANGLGNSISPVLDPDEEIETEGPANLFRGMEGVGGKLFLTNQKLIFKSHSLNINTGQSDISYKTIADFQSRKTSKLINNGLRITTLDGVNYDFVVNDREIWMEKLQEKLKRDS